jgi:gluconolactonase
MTQMTQATQMRELTSGLEFPEGPIAMSDGSIVLTEIKSGRIARVTPDGARETVAEPGGGPNGAALGPDGKLYVANNGGCFVWLDVDGLTVPHQPNPEHESGWIERIDLETGEVEVLYRESDGRPLLAPNDIVFDREGGFYFTDHGVRDEYRSDRTAIHYGKADGSDIHEVARPLDGPNGIGLSPDGSRLYVSETPSGRVFWWDVEAPGVLVQASGGLLANGGTLLAGLPGMQLFDSMAVDSAGHVCVATLLSAGVTRISPDGEEIEFFATGDILTTNICFGGDDLRTAYVTLSGTGRLVTFEWPVPGDELPYSA